MMLFTQTTKMLHSFSDTMHYTPITFELHAMTFDIIQQTLPQHSSHETQKIFQQQN
jgi:hypothetical protein